MEIRVGRLGRDPRCLSNHLSDHLSDHLPSTLQPAGLCVRRGLFGAELWLLYLGLILALAKVNPSACSLTANKSL